MTLVTIQVIEGLERGRVYRELAPPVTIGREDDNSIRLNDERVSRFHAKIQEEGGRVILTDLDSTNGTRVNGHPVQMRVLQAGDQLAIGRCLLIFGSDQEIAERAAQLRDNGRDDEDHTVEVPQGESGETFNQEHLDSADFAGDFDFLPGPDADLLASLKDELFPDGPPQPPLDLKPVQRAELSDFLAYAHEQIRIIVQSAAEDRPGTADAPQPMCVSWQAWQRLLNLEMHLARYLRHLAEPGE